jgi:hypothetical protein
MALKKIVFVAVLALGTSAFASSRVEAALTLNSDSVSAKKTEKKAPKAKVFDSLNTSDSQKTELPKNARHDATGGVFI